MSGDTPQGGERSRLDALLDKVRKLLALATSPNPHEAALAAARAQRMIEVHRLERWLDAEAQVADDPDPIVDARDEPLVSAKRIRPWRVALACALAEVNACVAYVLHDGALEHVVLVGRGRDRVAVHTMWTDLVRRIEWLSATHGPGKPRAWHEAFRVGAVDTVAEALAGVQAAAREEIGAGALVLVDPAVAAHRNALTRFVDEHLGLTKGRGLRVDANAYRRGRRAGDSL